MVAAGAIAFVTLWRRRRSAKAAAQKQQADLEKVSCGCMLCIIPIQFEQVAIFIEFHQANSLTYYAIVATGASGERLAWPGG